MPKIGSRYISDATLAEFRHDFETKGWRYCENFWFRRTSTMNEALALAGIHPKRKMKLEYQDKLKQAKGARR